MEPRSREKGTIGKRRNPWADPVTVALIGAGRVGTAFGVLLERAGHHVEAAAGRRASFERVQRYLPFAKFTEPADAARMAEVVIFGVPDDLIDKGCAAMAAAGAFRAGQFVLHTSGSVGLDALEPAAEAGAEILSLHPLQTFPEVKDGIERLPGSPMAVSARTETAYVRGEQLATALGAIPFRLAEESKALYHAAAVFCSNYLVVVEGMAEELFRMAGVEDPAVIMQPLARAAFEATMERGAAAALTGPAARGDVRTVVRTLEELESHARGAAQAYAVLAREAARLAEIGGKLTVGARRRLEEVLDRWT
jgi:predicted short-subunit dehydrogenase-like oxidoreductase (DUF2520 family)